MTAISALFLKERVGWRRWTAVLVGFLGVVIALRPSAASLTLPALIALGGSLAFALLMIVTRVLRETNDTVLIATQYVGTLAVRCRHGAVRLGDADGLRPDIPLRLRRGLDHRAVLRQPLAQARARERRGAVSVHADPVGGAARLAGVRRGSRRFHARRRRRSSSAAGLYIFWREQLWRRASNPHDRTTAPRRARRHRPDGARHLPVLLQRRARQMAARHLLGVADAADPQHRGDRGAVAVHLARGQGGIRRRAAAGTADRCAFRSRSPNRSCSSGR